MDNQYYMFINYYSKGKEGKTLSSRTDDKKLMGKNGCIQTYADLDSKALTLEEAMKWIDNTTTLENIPGRIHHAKLFCVISRKQAEDLLPYTMDFDNKIV